jgi:hypothetical protein
VSRRPRMGEQQTLKVSKWVNRRSKMANKRSKKFQDG